MKTENAQAVTLNVPISDLILTPLTCASVVNEILKGIIYEKSQIPYPYHWLKTVVNKRRKRMQSEEATPRLNFSLENHFRIVSSTYDAAEEIMKNICVQFSDRENKINDIVILFGTSPLCPKEIFTVSVSSLKINHLDQNHLDDIDRTQRKILRNIFLSEEWIENPTSMLPCTNIHIYIKTERSISNTNSFFIPTKLPPISGKVRSTVIQLYHEDMGNFSCCGNLQVFENSSASSRVEDNQTSKQRTDYDETDLWYKADLLIKGFKNYTINKVSACDLW